MSRPGSLRRGALVAVAAPLVVTGLAVVALAGPAQGAAPGRNGEIAFVRDSAVWVAAPDGTGQHQLISDAGGPAWSADGHRLAFERDDGIWVAGADGRVAREVVTDAGHPTWSPSGDRLAFERDNHTWVVDVDGADAHQVSPDQVDPDSGYAPLAIDPDWSPDGSTIAVGSHAPFYPGSDLYGISPDGSDWRSLGEGYFDPDWSPGGDAIVHADSAEEYHHNGIGIYIGDDQLISPEYFIGQDDEVQFVNSMSPSWSPDGTTILFSTDVAPDLQSYADTPGIWAYSLADHTSHPLIADATDPDWQPLTGPDCSTVTATPDVLTPADGTFRTVRLAAPGGGRVHVLSVRSDEARRRRPDWRFVRGSDHLSLRAESDPSGDGRVYTIAFSLTGSSGRCRGTATVTVPAT